MKFKEFVNILTSWFPGLIQTTTSSKKTVTVHRFSPDFMQQGDFDVDFKKEQEMDASYRAFKKALKAVHIRYDCQHTEGIFPRVTLLKYGLTSFLENEDLVTSFQKTFADYKARAVPSEISFLPQFTEEVEHINPTPDEWKAAVRFFDKNRTKTKLSRKKELVPHSFIRTNQEIYALGKLLAKGKGEVGKETKVKWVETREGLVGVVKIEHHKLSQDSLAQSRIQRKVGFNYGLMQHNSKTYAISPYFPKESLMDYIEKNIKNLTNEEILAVFLACCELNYVFQQWRLIHCDIKPENYQLLIKDGSIIVRMLDFEFSKKIPKFENSIRSEHLRGTRCYIAPEIWDSRIYFLSKRDLCIRGVASSDSQYQSQARL